MKRIVRPFFLFFTAAFWLIVIFAALNIYQVVKWRRIVSSNPFVVAAHANDPVNKPWPIVRQGTRKDVQHYPYPQTAEASGLNRPAIVEPPEDPRGRLDKAAARFRSLNDEERRAFDAGLKDLVVVTGRDGIITKVYTPREELNDRSNEGIYQGKPVTNLVNERDAARLNEMMAHVFQNGQSELQVFTGGGAGDTEIFVFPLPDASGTIAEAGVSKGVVPNLQPGSLWEEPSFKFKRHAQNPQSGRSTNNFGFRGNDIDVPKPANTVRIVCVGGSTTEEGPSDDATYPAILERKLNAIFDGRPKVEVVNCGIPASYSARERARTLDFLDLDPDLILYYHGTNDLAMKRFSEWCAAAAQWRKALRFFPFLNQHLNGWFLPSEAAMADSLQATTLRNLRLMVTTARPHHVDFAFASFAYPDLATLTGAERDYFEYSNASAQLEPSGRYVTLSSYVRAMKIFNRLIKALCDQEKLLYIPVAESLRGGAEVFWDVCHLRDEGIELKTDIMAPYVRDYIEKKGNGAQAPAREAAPERNP